MYFFVSFIPTGKGKEDFSPYNFVNVIRIMICCSSLKNSFNSYKGGIIPSQFHIAVYVEACHNGHCAKSWDKQTQGIFLDFSNQ